MEKELQLAKMDCNNYFSVVITMSENMHLLQRKGKLCDIA